MLPYVAFWSIFVFCHLSLPFVIQEKVVEGEKECLSARKDA
jgi:hypothetical protein